MSAKSSKLGWEFFDYWCQEEWDRYIECDDPVKFKLRCMWARKKRNRRHSKLCLNHPEPTIQLHVYRNEAVDWFVAESEHEATMLYIRWNVENKTGASGDDLSTDFIQCGDSEILSILDDDQMEVVKKDCESWCISNRKGFLCSENF